MINNKTMSITKCVETFQEVVVVLQQWLTNGYRLYLVKYDSDDFCFYIQGSKDVIE